ncbi:hypothetical protein [Desulfovibrio mangrovi]|uniref:hypothetical protein n=1 Tax=Desulfovibrio mangrovi TaxID=2976983 RepID=UPI003B848B38
MLAKSPMVPKMSLPPYSGLLTGNFSILFSSVAALAATGISPLFCEEALSVPESPHPPRRRKTLNKNRTLPFFKPFTFNARFILSSWYCQFRRIRYSNKRMLNIALKTAKFQANKHTPY